MTLMWRILLMENRYRRCKLSNDSSDDLIETNILILASILENENILDGGICTGGAEDAIEFML